MMYKEPIDHETGKPKMQFWGVEEHHESIDAFMSTRLFWLDAKRKLDSIPESDKKAKQKQLHIYANMTANLLRYSNDLILADIKYHGYREYTRHDRE